MIEAYLIGINIALANGVSPVLAIIGRDLLGLKTKIADVEGAFSKWAPAIGLASAAIGAGLVVGMEKAIGKASQ
jgi:hypothetical protein